MTLNIKDFETMISDHLYDQPYECICGICGENLVTDTRLDKDFDMKVTVYPCRNGCKE